MAELPIRVYDDNGRINVRCLCDAEATAWRRGSEQAAPIIRAARSNPVPILGLTTDTKPAAILRLVLHARSCLRGQNIARGAA